MSTAHRRHSQEKISQAFQSRLARYHIVHFDGHRGDGPVRAGDSCRFKQGYRGKLVFETEEDDPDPIEAEVLTTLLREYRDKALGRLA